MWDMLVEHMWGGGVVRVTDRVSEHKMDMPMRLEWDSVEDNSGNDHNEAFCCYLLLLKGLIQLLKIITYIFMNYNWHALLLDTRNQIDIFGNLLITCC